MARKKENFGPQMAISALMSDAEAIKDSDSLMVELLKLSNLVNKPNRDDAKRDNRIVTLAWDGPIRHLDARVNRKKNPMPPVIAQLIQLVLTRSDITNAADTKTCLYRVRYVASMPSSAVTIAEGIGSVASRMLFHFGASEIYNLDKPLVSDIDDTHKTLAAAGDLNVIYHRQIYLPSNHSFYMYNAIIADATISITSRPPTHKPSMRGAPQAFIRIPKQKITVLIDIIDTEEGVNDIVNDAATNMVKMKGRLPEQMFKSDDGANIPTKSEEKAIIRDIGI